MTSGLRRGDEVSWDGDSWEVVSCGREREPLADGTNGGWLCEIEHPTRGLFVVREADVEVTAWRPAKIPRIGKGQRP